MNSPVDPGIRRCLELLVSFKAVCSEFAGKEARLAKDSESRRLADSRKNREEAAEIARWVDAETTKAEQSFAEQERHTRAACESRKQAVSSAGQRGMNDLMGQAMKAKERWRWQLQMRHFSATRDRDQKLKATDDAYDEFSASVAAEQSKFARLEKDLAKAFRGYAAFLRLLRPAGEVTLEAPGDSRQILQNLQERLPAMEQHLGDFRHLFLPRLFSRLPLEASIPIALCAGAIIGYFLVPGKLAFPTAGGAALALAAIVLLLHRIGGSQAREVAGELAREAVAARHLFFACSAVSRNEHDRTRRKIQKAHDVVCDEVNGEWARADVIEQSFAVSIREKIERQVPRLLELSEQRCLTRLRQCESDRATRLDEIRKRAEESTVQSDEAAAAATATRTEWERGLWSELQSTWIEAITPVCGAIAATNALLEKYSPPWSSGLAQHWTPPEAFPPAAKFASLRPDLSGTALPKDPRLALPGPADISIPLALAFPGQGGLLLETSGTGQQESIRSLNNLILRLLSTIPPGKVSFTLIDPIGLGQSFAGLMHLADYEETLINRRIWTQRDQIEERLEELNGHIEKVIQMYLRNEYATITEYNEQAGSVAEKYHFLVVADFPANFSETAARWLQSIVSSGPRCGVFTLIHRDSRQALPDGFSPDEMEKNSIWLRATAEGWELVNERLTFGKQFVLEAPPSPEVARELVHRIGRTSIDSNRVEVPFSQISPKEEELWTNSTTSELRIPIGRTGATKLQYLAIGKGTRQHALFAGKTGSGKSTLFHVIITNLALSCSPQEVEFYLIDFKKGVEFKCYAAHRLPHARVVAIESDREFALSVLRRVDEELKRRGDLFRALGVQDLAGYKKAGGLESVPRTLLIIDEFQEFFVDDDAIAQAASLLFDRIVRQGRAFGIHVLLGSQTLGGAYTLARATLGQMVIRVALQCNEADSYLIMDDNNPAPRLLTRPGEGIYNDQAGAMAANSPFQVVWLPDDERDAQLEKVCLLAERQGFDTAGPIVFEGNAPADIAGNSALRRLINGPQATPTQLSRCWLGAPNSIKGPTEVVFHRQSGNHLLIVGQNDETIGTMLAASIIALTAQHPAGSANIVLFHAAGAGQDGLLPRVYSSLCGSQAIVQPNDVSGAMNRLAEELQARVDGRAPDDAPPVFVFIHGLQKFKKLRHEDEFDFSADPNVAASPGSQLNALIVEGSSHGIHLIVTLDTFNNIGRSLSRKALAEFEMRVVFQMSANDSASLIDSPQAASLGLHRALLYNEREGSLETFRPYAPPSGPWLDETCGVLSVTNPDQGTNAQAVRL